MALAPAETSGQAVAAAPVPRRPPPQEAWDWQVPASRGDTDSATAIASRYQRAMWRLLHPRAWQADLQTLSHFDPEFVYDENHEYYEDWTTDPDYGKVHVRNFPYDLAGFVSPDQKRHNPLIEQIRETLCTPLGEEGVHRIQPTPDYHFPEAVGRDLSLFTGGRKPKTQVKPDLVVLPEGRDDRSVKEARVIRTDPEHPVPEMVVEVVSPSSAVRDYGDKAVLYERLGVKEYLIVDPGEPPEGDSRGYLAQLVLYRLQSGNNYVRVEGEGSASNMEVCSAVIGSLVRLKQDHPDDGPVFQWFDPNMGTWRDALGDKLRESEERGKEHGEERGRAQTILTVVGHILSDKGAVDAIATHWQEFGVPDDMDNLLTAVLDNPAEWREIFGIAVESKEISEVDEEDYPSVV